MGGDLATEVIANTPAPAGAESWWPYVIMTLSIVFTAGSSIAAALYANHVRKAEKGAEDKRDDDREKHEKELEKLRLEFDNARSKADNEAQSRDSRTQLEFDSVKSTIEVLQQTGIQLREELKAVKADYILLLEELRKEREHSRLLQNENTELKAKVAILEGRVVQLEREVKSLEVSRDDARKACSTERPRE